MTAADKAAAEKAAAEEAAAAEAAEKAEYDGWKAEKAAAAEKEAADKEAADKVKAGEKAPTPAAEELLAKITTLKAMEMLDSIQPKAVTKKEEAVTEEPPADTLVLRFQRFVYGRG